MQPQNSVITEAVKGYGEKLAEIYGLSVGRFYQILEADFYNKTRRLIRSLAAIDKNRVRLIKADLDALFAELLGDSETEVSLADVHKETSELVQSIIERKPKAQIKKEARDVVAISQTLIEQLDEKDTVRLDYTERQKVDFAN